jgi:hypothetical protein
MTKTNAIAFLSTAVLSGTITFATMSRAATGGGGRMIPAITCQKSDTTAQQPQYIGSKLTNNNLERSYNVSCPFIDVLPQIDGSEGDQKQSVTDIWIDGQDNCAGYFPPTVDDAGIGATACSQAWNSSGTIYCGGGASSGDAFTGETSIHISGPALANSWGPDHSWDYGYLSVTIPCVSHIRGILTTNAIIF